MALRDHEHVSFLFEKVPRSDILRIVSVGTCIWSVAFIAGNDERYQSPAYDVIFALAPRQVWGAVMLACSLFAAVSARAISSVLLATCILAYSGCMIAAMLISDEVSLTAGVWQATVGAVCIYALLRQRQ